MSESIATRVSRIIAGGAHALLDKAENLAPAAVMSQSIREIEQVAAEVRSDLGKCEAAKHLVLMQIAKLDQEHETLTEQIEFALGQNRDDLATAAIGRQTDIEDLLPVLQRGLDEQLERGKELGSYIIALLAKKRELEQILADHLATSAGQQSSALPTDDRQARIDKATTSFARILEQQTGIDLGVGAPGYDAGKLKELAEIRRQLRITDRLSKRKNGRASH